MNAAADESDPARFEFGRWRFDAETGDLFDGRKTHRLEPQVARLLHYLLVHQHTLITRDELMAAVWDNRIVSDHAVNRCVSILRQTLSPDDKNAYIETVVRRGFISHFPEPASGTSRPANPAPYEGRARNRMSWRYVLAVAATALALFIAFRVVDAPGGRERAADRTADGTATPMVAVLPFLSEGFSGDSAFLANGIHDDLLTRLAQLESLRVISRTSVSEYRDSNQNIRKIGRQLGADAILEGGVQRIGDQIRINVQLIDAGSDVHLWAAQYDRELTPANIFDVQAEIARSVASAMHSTLTPQDAAQLRTIPTENMAAYRAYHEAMALRNTGTIAAPAYIDALERAVSLDTDFVRAWTELAGSLSYANLAQRDPESIRRLENILQRVRSLAPQSPEYLIAQSYYVYYVLKEHDAAFELLQEAQELKPSDPQLLELQAWIQRRQGDIDGMIESIRRARTLDPRNPYWTNRLVSSLMLAHRYDEAAMEARKSRVDDFTLSVLRSVLRVREHRQPGRLLSELLGLQHEYDVEADAFELWEAHVAARYFDGAASLLAAAEAPPADEWAAPGVPGIELARVITDHFLSEQARTGP
ncbi:MAG: winged helix-turn-helix domain-containing tetratricopeptide repeat protein, partial [Candidatus Wenzhouxiangella sp. M2_3B_020]